MKSGKSPMDEFALDVRQQNCLSCAMISNNILADPECLSPGDTVQKIYQHQLRHNITSFRT